MNGNPEPGRGPLEKAIAITGGDAAYFDLMRDCIASLQATEEGRSLALGVLDCGLTDDQRDWCRERGWCRSGISISPAARL